ncbi:MAG: extracellular solute-binding protein [Spirochaetaceae bacterium]
MRKILQLNLMLLIISSCTVKEEIKIAQIEKPPVIDISVAFWEIEKFLTSDNDDYLKFIEEKFNINIVPKNLTWAEYNQKILYWAASNKLPDIFVGSFMLSDEYYSWIDNNQIRSLPADLSKYPYIKSITEQEGIKNLSTYGKLYLFPRINALDSTYNSAERGIVSRKDWRVKLGLDIPETFEEYVSLAKAFKENDPDGNGIDDTTGITFANKQYTSTVFLSSVPEAASKTWKFEDNKWIPGYISKNMVTGIMELNRLWKEELLDPQLLSLSGEEGKFNFCLGKTGMLFTQIKPRVIYSLSDLWLRYNDTDLSDVIEFLPIWKNEEGYRYSFHEGKNFWSSSFFSSNVSDKKMEKILSLYDYLLSEEGQNSIKYGIPGVDFTLEDGVINIIDSSDMNKKYPSLNIFIDLPSWGGDISNWIVDEYSLAIYKKNIMESCLDLYEKNREYLSPVNMDIQYLNTPTKSKFEKGDAIFDTILNVSIADDPIKEWEKQIKLLQDEGLDMAIDEVNNKATQLGIINP